jgi:hypothetical protein
MPVHTYTTLNDSSSGTIATDARGINGSVRGACTHKSRLGESD